MTTYVDTSALLKLMFAEAETPAVRAWVATTGTELASSLLVRTEAHCAARRRAGAVAGGAVDAVLGVLELVDLLPVDLDVAATGTHRLRAADAIHLATAERIGADSMLVYDVELAMAAETAGMTVIAPR